MTGQAVSLSSSHVGHQYVVSGLSIDATENIAAGGWPDVITGREYALHLARDRVLQVGGAPRATGWDPERGQAVSDMTDGYCVFTLAGERAFDVLCRGAELDLRQQSRSVARLLWGMQVFLYRHETDTTFRLHIERSDAQSLYLALRTALRQIT